MAYLDTSAAQNFILATGSGTPTDPYVISVSAEIAGIEIPPIDVTIPPIEVGAVDLAAGAEVIILDGGGSVTVDGPLTDTELRAADVRVTLDGETVAIASIAAGDNNIGNVDVLTIAAGNNLIGLVGASDIAVTVTPTCDTSAYASGDLIFDATEVAAAVRANGGHCVLHSVVVHDKADQGVAMTLVILNAATDMGTLNSAPDPDDAEAATIIGWVPIAASDYIDVGASDVACVRGIGLGLKAGAATTSIWIAAINGTGTPTYGASDLVITLFFMRS